jgi:hypothetical protein
MLISCSNPPRYAPGPGCGRKSRIKNLDVYVDHHYSYTDEDWYELEKYYVCPHCGIHNRMIEDKQWLNDHVELFRSEITLHDGEQLKTHKPV